MRTLAVALCVSMAACTGSAEAPRRTYTLRLARTTSNELSDAIKRLPNVKSEIVSDGGSSITSLVELRDGRTDIANPVADVAYLAYAGQLEEINKPFDQLRGMAVTGFTAIHLVVAPKARVRSLDELTGLHVSLGPPGSSVALVTNRLLHAQGIQSRGVRTDRFPNAEMLKLLVNGDIDAAFAMYNPGAQTITSAMKAGGHLLDIEGSAVEQLRTQYPYLKRTLIPAGTYPNQPNAVRTIGIDVAMVCKADLDEDLVYSLLDAYFAAMPPGTPPDLDRAPATPVPLHPGAARYYRQRELSR
jgi:TRAP transporter TAXI family solute receptor